MSNRLYEKRSDQKGSVVASVAIHIVAIALIASITFRYPITALFGNHDPIKDEHIQYVTVRPQPLGSGVEKAEKKPPKKAQAPVRLIAPTAIPTELPPVQPATPTSGVPTGVPGGSGGSPTGIATGATPELPDPRIELRPNALRVPISMAQRNDSAVKAIYAAYRQAEIEAEAHQSKNPRDWTFERNGGKYGMDSSYIYLGKFKIPSAILAALPFNTGGVDGARILANRNADWIRNDIYQHAQGLSEDDFRAAVRRIRERKEREHAEEERDKASRQTPLIP
jgi:hypothetical protein